MRAIIEYIRLSLLLQPNLTQLRLVIHCSWCGKDHTQQPTHICTKELSRELQVVQTKAAKVVTKLDWYTSTRVVLQQYHTVLMVHKILRNESPAYLYSMFSTNYSYRTRQAGSGMIRSTRTPNLDLATGSFRYRASKMYNDLPEYVKGKTNVDGFKAAVKDWIRGNIPVE